MEKSEAYLGGQVTLIDQVCHLSLVYLDDHDYLLCQVYQVDHLNQADLLPLTNLHNTAVTFVVHCIIIS